MEDERQMWGFSSWVGGGKLAEVETCKDVRREILFKFLLHMYVCNCGKSTKSEILL